MIRPNKKIGIVYSRKSKKYADELVEIIKDYRERGYCIESVIIDDNLTDQETHLESRIFNNLSKCDYAFIFLYKDLKIDDSLEYVSKPNVMLELGFFMGRLDNNCIQLVIDFPHEDIPTKYIAPTDILGWYYHVIDSNSSYSNIKTLFESFIQAHKNITKIDGYNANDLVTSLILNSCYKTDYSGLFTIEQLTLIEKFSVEYQLKEILDIWIEEKNLLSDVQRIVYLFERIVYLPFFPNEIIHDKIINFLSIDGDKNNEYILACHNILQNIRDYEEYKRQRPPFETREFYLEIVKEINTSYEKLKICKVAPIIECVTQNYLGLGYLNAYSVSIDQGISYKNLLQKSMKHFLYVIELTESNLGDNLLLFQAFARYNLARVKRNLGKNAETEYRKAIQRRETISKYKEFPTIFKLNFALEKILAEYNFYSYMYEEERISKEKYKERVDNLYNELNEIQYTPAQDISLFRTLKDRFKNVIDKLK